MKTNMTELFRLLRTLFIEMKGRVSRKYYWASVGAAISMQGAILYHEEGLRLMLLRHTIALDFNGELAYRLSGNFDFLALLGLLVPVVTLTVRRLHDTGRSGAWGLLALTGIGLPVVVYWLLLPSAEDNAYGLQPNERGRCPVITALGLPDETEEQRSTKVDELEKTLARLQEDKYVAELEAKIEALKS